MQNPKNKANLHWFITSSLCDHPEVLPENVTIILGGMSVMSGETVTITNTSSSAIEELSCGEHEEADTRITAHLAYCVETLGYTRAIIHATDTGIIMLCMYHFCCRAMLQELWIEKNDKYLCLSMNLSNS
jgi:hypothetical protein